MTKTQLLQEKKIQEFREKFLMKGSECTWESYPNPEEIEEFMLEAFKEIESEKEKEIITEYGHFRNVLQGVKGVGRTLRYYLLPSSKHTEEDERSDF